MPPVRVPVPPSKSWHQRAWILSALGDGVAPTVNDAASAPGEDVERVAAAVAALGAWQDGAVGHRRDRQVLDAGEGATGFRALTALACLRPVGARTLVTGRPALRRRPHAPLRRALVGLGGHVRRRSSGALRIVARPLRGGRVDLEGHRSSQFATALLLVGARQGGLEVHWSTPPVSRSYLGLTVAALRAAGLEAGLELEGPRPRAWVAPGAPDLDGLVVPPDASAAASVWALAVAAGGDVVVPGVTRDDQQPDMALLPLLEAMGARVTEEAPGEIQVGAPDGPLRAPGTVDLRDAPDLLPLVAALGALAEGTTRIQGAAHARWKESDRPARMVRMLTRLGGHAALEEDGTVSIQGGPLSPARVDVRGDHRLAFAAEVLAARVPDIQRQGSAAVGKSHPGFQAAVEAVMGSRDRPRGR